MEKVEKKYIYYASVDVASIDATSTEATTNSISKLNNDDVEVITSTSSLFVINITNIIIYDSDYESDFY
jgi:hypothetical protein